MKNVWNKVFKINFLFLFVLAAGQLCISPLSAQGCSGCFMYDGGMEYVLGNPQAMYNCYGAGACSNSGSGSSCGADGFSSFVPIVGIEAAFGETVGLDDDYGTIGTQIYTSFGPDPSLFFITTFKAHVLNNHGHWRFASNIGLGVRTYDFWAKAIRGIHLFFDVREGRRHNFDGFGLSLEYLTKWYRLRLNGYLPVGKTSKTTRKRHFDFQGGFMAECELKQNALKGADLDLEIPFIMTCSWELSVNGGIYYFSNCCENTSAGGMGGARLSWNDVVVIEGRYTYDRRFGSRGQGIISFNYPICGTFAKRDPCDNYTRQFVRRFDIMPLDDCCTWHTNFDQNCSSHNH